MKTFFGWFALGVLVTCLVSFLGLSYDMPIVAWILTCVMLFTFFLFSFSGKEPRNKVETEFDLGVRGLSVGVILSSIVIAFFLEALVPGDIYIDPKDNSEVHFPGSIVWEKDLKGLTVRDICTKKERQL
jgi:hypothetical protein